jgi:diamine N-acetyltransferase
MSDASQASGPELRLVEVTLDNFHDVMALQTAPEQAGFVGSNAESLAECAYIEGFVPRAVCLNDDIVGLVVWGPYYPDLRYNEPPEQQTYILDHVMIDARFQGRGFGRRLVELALGEISFIGDCQRIVLKVETDNRKAIELYRQAGFSECGRDQDGDLIMERAPDLS